MQQGSMLDFVSVPEAWRSDEDYIEICGNTFPIEEFDNTKRMLWMEIREKRSLTSIIQEFSELQSRVDEFAKDESIEVLNKRKEKVDLEIDQIIDSTPNDKWTDDVEDKVNALLAVKKQIMEKIKAATTPKERRLAEEAPEILASLEKLKNKQQEIYLEFVWKVSRSEKQESRSLEEFIADAKGSDRHAAEEWVIAGNFTWEAKSLNRQQKRLMKKHMKKN